MHASVFLEEISGLNCLYLGKLVDDYPKFNLLHFSLETE